MYLLNKFDSNNSTAPFPNFLLSEPLQELEYFAEPSLFFQTHSNADIF